MEKLTKISAIAAPMLRINIDTDQIIPARFLVRVTNDGLGEGLFAGQRYGRDGKPNPDFILNRAPYDRAEILLADRNFGCGSSREAAPMALRQRGFRAVIAPSFGGIFFNNCFRNGVVPVELPIEAVRQIAAEVEATQGQGKVGVDLEGEAVTTPSGAVFKFRSPPLLREMLLAGADEVDLTLRRGEQIGDFRGKDSAKRPWAYRPGLAN
ncbi:MAG: 3-isopropylmalate dehydratase small subunit [Alphaproteobacteria bacterium]|nr:3-isopropylmalate dehydratase small subunit [Alphaproteobacteria bacterium]